MAAKENIACPAYLVTDTQTGSFGIMSSTGEDWFPVFRSLDLAEQHAKQVGSASVIRTVTDAGEFRQILETNPKIAGFLICNEASPELFSPVNRQDLLGKIV